MLIDAFNDIESKPLTPPIERQDSNSFGQFGALQVGGLGAKALRIDDQGLWLGAFKFADAPFSVSMEGAITGTSGTIAGWTIGSTTISKNNATLDSAGQITLGTANDIAILSSVNTTYRLWIGDATAGNAAFSVTKAGALLATSATITGSITATSGTIGGFTIGATYLYAGSGASTCGLSPADYPFWAGATYADRASAPFRVTPAGAITATSATITGAITTAAGSSLSANYLDAGNISVGGTGQVDAILIKSDETHGDKNLRWEGLSRIWEDASNNLGIRATASVYLYAGNYSQEASFHSGSQSVFYHGVDCRGNLNIKSGVLRIEGLSSDPGGVGNGSIYYNTTSNTLRALNGGVWYTIQVA